MVTSAGFGKMHEITVHQTYKENGEEGPKRLFVYVDGGIINTHVVHTLQDAVRIKENYESSLNKRFAFTYTKPNG